MKKNILLIAGLCTFSLSAIAAYGTNIQNTPTKTVSEDAQTIIINDAWARRSMAPNNNSAAYMKINNQADKDITIIGASSANIANNVELHKSFVDEKGISRMTSIDKIVVPAKTEIELAPGGIHIMLLDLKKTLNSEDKFNIEIRIEGSDKPIIVETEVK